MLLCTGSSFSQAELGGLADYLRALKLNNYATTDFFQIRRHKEDFVIAELNGYPVKSWTSDDLLSMLVDTENYKENIYQRVAVDLLPNSEITIEETFTESRIIVEQSKEPVQNFSTFIVKWISERSKGHIALLGEYGQGKSTSVLKFVHDVLQKRVDCLRLPILIELRGKSPKTQTPLETLAAWGAYYGITGSALFALLRAGKLLIIFDGFDEMDGLDDERMRYENFVSLWAFSAFENARIVITGRPELFLDDAELRRDLAVHPDYSDGSFTTVVKLQRFDEGQIRDALRNLDAPTREEIVDLASADNAFMDIVSRPSLLQPLAAIWKDPALVKNKKNINSAFVIDLFLQNTFRRQAEKARADRSLRFMRLNQSELAFFTRAVAVYMAKEHLPNQITNIQLVAVALKVWQSIGDSLRFEARPELREDSAPLKVRLKDVPDAVELIVTNIRSYGIIVRDYSRSDTFKFSHKSYLELLVAKTAAELILNSKSSEHVLIMNCLSPTINELLISPVAASFCGESMATAVQQENGSPVQTLDKIYDFIARPGMASLVPRSFHKLMNIQLPTTLVAGRLRKFARAANRRKVGQDEAIRKEVIRASNLPQMMMTATIAIISVMFISRIRFPLMGALIPDDNVLIIALPIVKYLDMPFITGALIPMVCMGFILLLGRMFNFNLLREDRARTLVVLSDAAVGKVQMQKYYGRKFCRVMSLIFRLSRV